MNRFQKYDKKCRFYIFRLRKDKDEKYINFLDKCQNKSEFLRRAIDLAGEEKDK